MRTVFAVNNGGSYSDYRMECFFIKREDADAFAVIRGGDVEEMVLYGAGEAPEKRIIWHVSQRIDFETMTSWSSTEWSYEGTNVTKRPTVTATNFRGGPIECNIRAVGLDKDVCVQAVADRVAKARAEFAVWNLDWRNVNLLPADLNLEWFAEDGTQVGKERTSRSFWSADRPQAVQEGG